LGGCVFRSITVGLFAFVLPVAALADAVVTSATGDVQSRGLPVTSNQRITSGATVTTGAGAQAVLRFDDGQSVVLNQNTEFRIVDFRYSEAAPSQDRSVFDLLRGAARFVTGAIGRRNPNAFQARAPQATIGVRGTDFMIAIVNPLYLSVLEGAVAASNSAGTAVFSAGSLASVGSATTLAATTTAAALPAAASSAFASLQSVVISGVVTTTTAAGTATGAGAATGTAVGLGTVGTIIGIAAAAAVIGAAASSNDNRNTTTTTNH
jgi:hypothetical protein